MADLSIGAIARRAGIESSTIRYYEKIGLLPKPMRAGGRRRYQEDILDRIAIIQFGKRVGLSLAELKILLDTSLVRPPPERWRKLAHEKVAQVDQLIAEASVVRQLLLETLDQKCPKLVERGRSLEREMSEAAARIHKSPTRIRSHKFAR